VNTQEAASVYEKLFIAFPQLRDWLAGTKHARATHEVWCGVLAGVDYADAITVVDRMIRGDEPTPEAYEREKWPQMIRAAASAIRGERVKRTRMDKYHVAANEQNTSSERFTIAMRESRRLGDLVMAGKLSPTMNLMLVDELVDWSERDGTLPEWIGSEVFEVSKQS
jgi:hypothetical protein